MTTWHEVTDTLPSDSVSLLITTENATNREDRITAENGPFCRVMVEIDRPVRRETEPRFATFYNHSDRPRFVVDGCHGIDVVRWAVMPEMAEV